MDALLPCLTMDGLFALALCGLTGYMAASRRDAEWELVCVELDLPRSQYDKCWLDTFARSLRQALFRSSAVSPWVHSPKISTSGIVVQFRQQDNAANMIAWMPSSPIPWFTLTRAGILYVYADIDGTRRPCPDPSFLTSLLKLSTVSDSVSKVVTKTQHTLVTGGVVITK